MTISIQYIENVDIHSVLDFSYDDLTNLKGSVIATLKVIDGLMAGDLQYDVRSALIVAELIAGLREKVDGCIARICVDLMHAEERPATNALARAVGLSVTKLKAIDAEAEVIPDTF